MNRKAFLIMLVLMAFTTACDAFADVPPTAPPVGPTPTQAKQVCRALEVVYIKAGTAWLWSDNNGNKLPLTSEGGVTQVKISPDCRWVAYLQNGQLWLTGINPNGSPDGLPSVVISSKYLEALDTQGGQIAQFDFSPDSQTIYFIVTYSGDFSGLDLFKIEMSTLMPVRLIDPGLGGNYTISPDSKCMTIARANQLDVYCKGDSQPQRAFLFSNECSLGAHMGVDVQWMTNSSGFYVVIPQCDGGSDNGHLVFQQVPLDKIPDIVGSTYPSSVFRILGKPSDKVDISPDGKCLIHQEDTPNLRNLHVVCRTDSDPYFSDAIYVSYPKGSLEFSGWSPDSQYFVISMPSNNNSGSKVFFANPGSPAQPLLSEQVAENADTNNQAKDIKWVSSSLFLFIFKDGLCKEPFQKSGQSTAMTSIDSGPIDHDINGIYDYDFAAPP